MIKFENTEVVGWEAAIRGMRNPMNSWEMSDSYATTCDTLQDCSKCTFSDGSIQCKQQTRVTQQIPIIGPNDLSLMKKLRNAGTDHRKFMRMIVVYVDITAPLYWWKEFDTYKVGTVANSCSTMHKIAAKEFTIDDFSTEHLTSGAMNVLLNTIEALNDYRAWYLRYDSMREKDKLYFEAGINCKEDLWHQMIQLLPSSYNQKRTVMLSYEVLANIYKSRKHHKLDEWSESTGPVEDLVYGPSLCDWIKSLPYSELITGEYPEFLIKHTNLPDAEDRK